jgi:hypothetical protein
MNIDPLEERLRRQALRPLPDEWRAEILSAAGERRAKEAPGRGPSAMGRMAWWQEWLWPSPQAWAGLAVAWLVILLARVGTPGPVNAASRSVGPQAGQNLRVLLEERRELTRLLGSLPEPAAPAKVQAPGPRSARHAEISLA